MTTTAIGRLSILGQIHVLDRLTGTVVEEALERHDVGGPDFAIYSLLKTYGPMTVTELARSAGTPLPSVSKILSRLEARGHLERTANPEDGRSTLVSLTPEGEALHAGARPDFLGALGRVKQALGADLDLARWALARIDSALRAATGDASAPDPGPRPDHSVAYRGDPLTAAEEEQVRTFIAWTRSRRSP